MRKYTYTYDDVVTGWKKKNNIFINEFVVSDKNDDNIDLILMNIKELVTRYKAEKNVDDEYISVNESIFDKLLNKAKKDKKTGISSAEYVATAAGYDVKAKTDKSFYDTSHEIEIVLEDGSVSKGIIRISDHYVNLQKWAENNRKYDFGISFVVQETTNEYLGNDIIEVPNRTICVFEYVFEYDRKCVGLLDQLISEILLIKRTHKYISNRIILGVAPNVVNSTLSEKLINAIKRGLYKVLR